MTNEAQWQARRAAMAAARQQRAADVAAVSAWLTGQGRAVADAPFTGQLAPSGTGEASTARHSGTGGMLAGGSTLDYRQPLGSGLAGLADDYRTRVERRTAVRAARRAAVPARLAVKLAAWEDAPESLPCERLALPPVTGDAADWQGADTRTLLALSETGWETATEVLTVLERRYDERLAVRHALAALMADDGQSNEGRGTGERRASRVSVNGTEVRAGERWASTGHVPGGRWHGDDVKRGGRDDSTCVTTRVDPALLAQRGTAGALALSPTTWASFTPARDAAIARRAARSAVMTARETAQARLLALALTSVQHDYGTR